MRLNILGVVAAVALVAACATDPEMTSDTEGDGASSEASSSSAPAGIMPGSEAD